MTPKDKRRELIFQLKENLELLTLSRKVLDYSYEKCRKINLDKGCTAQKLESFEALTSRFARTSDILTQKLIKTLFLITQDIPKTFIDAANMLEKMEIIKKADIILDIRQLRNEIAHEYALRDINTIFKDVFKHVPLLFDIIDDVERYVNQLIKEKWPLKI